MPSMMSLAAEPRDRSVTPKALRRAGYIPGVLYGPGYGSLPLQFDEPSLLRALRAAGTSHLVELSIKGQADGTEVILFREVQRDPVTERVLHVDLYRTQAEKPLTLMVPIVQVGHAPAVEAGGVVTTLLNELEVECLPRDVPEEITVDLTRLVDMDSVITVADLDIPVGVTVLTPAATDVVRITVPTMELEIEEEEEEAVAEEAVEEAEEGEEEGEEGEE